MDLESGLYHDDPAFDDVVDKLSNDLFQISIVNGQVSEFLRRGRRPPSAASKAATTDQAMALVQQNQDLFRKLKFEIEEMQQWREPSAAQKYSQHKIAADFGRLFVEFKRIQEQVIEQAKSSTVPTDSVSHSNTSIELADETSLGPGREVESTSVPEQTLAFEDELAQDEVAFQQGLVQEREQEIENVAQGMNELNEIYMNLGTMVREQGVSLDSIESNLNNVATNVRNGAGQLTKAQRSQRRASGRMLCFLIILLVIAAFVIIAVRI